MTPPTPTEHPAPGRTDRQAGPMGKYCIPAGGQRRGNTGGEAMMVAVMQGRVDCATTCRGTEAVARRMWFVLPPQTDYTFTALADAMLIWCRFDEGYQARNRKPATRRPIRRPAHDPAAFHCLPVHEKLHICLGLADIFLRIEELHSSIDQRRDEIFETMFEVYRPDRLEPMFNALFDRPSNTKDNPPKSK